MKIEHVNDYLLIFGPIVNDMTENNAYYNYLRTRNEYKLSNTQAYSKNAWE